MYKFSMLL